MVSGRFKSKTFRKVFKRTPSGKNVVIHILKKPNKAKCAKCKGILRGIARERPTKMQNMPKSQKTVSRPYGGNLCSRCMRETIKAKINTK